MRLRCYSEYGYANWDDMGQAFFKGLLESGAPWGILCAALSFAVLTLWHSHKLLSDRLFALATKQVEVNTETRMTLTETRLTLQGVEKDVDAINRRIKS
jgi:hypothetical protein